MKKLYYKVFNLFFIGNRYPEYRSTLELAKQKGYSFYTLLEYSRMLKNESLKIRKPFIILRHDIDTDSKGALQFGRIEQELGIAATYYFRWSTWNDNTIQNLFISGHEIGYHIEEAAEYAVRHQLTSVEQVKKHITEIRQLFETRLQVLRRESNLKISGIAEHGDFVNVQLDLGNSFILQDAVYRKQNGIEYEAYDSELLDGYQFHVSDRPYPVYYSPAHPAEFIKTGQSFLFLTHPRWWRANPVINIWEDSVNILRRRNWMLNNE